MAVESPRALADLQLIADIADDLPLGVWVAGAPRGGLLYANRAFAEILGMKANPEVGVGEYSGPYGIHTLDGRLYPEDRLPFVRALVEKKTVCVDDIVIHRHDGGRVFVRAFARPTIDAAGEVVRVAVAFIDISLEVQARQRAESIEEQLTRVFAHTPIIVWAHDAEGKITLSQGRGLEVLGWNAEDLVGRSVWDLYKDAPDVLRNTRRSLDGEAFADVVEVGPLVFQTTYAPIRDAGGKVVRVVGVSTEISEQRAAETRLARAERVASLGVLAASIGHEINSPLSYATSNLERLARGLQSAERLLPPELFRELSECVVEARDGAERVTGTVRSLRDVSRGDVERRLVDVRTVVGRALRLAGTELGYRARVISDLPEIPPVMANEGQLAQVFINLLHNAAHAIVEGQALDNEIRVRARTEGGHVVVEVEDSGAGMAPEVQARIFEPFFTTKPVGEGTGLGLSICLGLLKGMGGQIECESEPGRGTTFRVRLPVAEGDSAGPVSRPEPASGTIPRAARRARVLIIDDDARLARSVKALLDDEHDVEVETSSPSALARLVGGERFEVVLCDLMMREMTGMDLYDKLRADKPEVARAFVFMTGGAFTARAQNFLDGVENPCLDKPFVRRELVAVIADRLAAGRP
ncbi:MAG: ATP-binding protein [Polyangiaceae bacterium]